VPVPQWWPAFVLGWLAALGVVAARLVQEPHGPLSLAAKLLGLALLAGLFLRVTLRGAMTPGDLSPAGPASAAVYPRLLLLAAMVLVILGFGALAPGDGAWWLVMHPLVAAGLVLPSALAAGVMAGMLGLAIAMAWLVTGRFEVMLLIQVAFGAGAVAIRQLTLSVAHLRAAREELARLAVTEERLRFARDLHDLLGHSLSVIVLKSELAGRLLPGAPERAAAEVGDIEHSAREALREVRRAVAGYRQPALRDELAAARELLTAAGISAAIEHTAGPLPATLDGLFAWAVREGVTNVIHHSAAKRCAIGVSRAGDLARVEVSDDGRGLGRGVREPSGRGGSGLAGLAERAAAHRGQLWTGLLPEGGFRMVVEAPTCRAASTHEVGDGGES
jgi:two-component system sensor histidine kinase DesK